VHEAEPSVFELEERAVRGDALDGAVDDGANFDLWDQIPFPEALPAPNVPPGPSPGVAR
jgi:hypothetical protein